MSDFIERVLERFALENNSKSWRDCCEETDGHFLAVDMVSLVETTHKIVLEKIDSMKIDIIGNCAYQGGDLPKKWLREEVPRMQSRNKALDELRCFLQEKEGD